MRIDSFQPLQFVTMNIFVLLALTVHEYCHGWAALRLGDDTASLSGRLNLNPIAHIDPLGTILLPNLLFFATGGAFTFGWARPVPVNPLRFRRDVTLRTGMSIVAAAGPLSNLILAALFAVLFRVTVGVASPYAGTMAELAALAATINLVLAFFNLVPIPPLDGSKAILHFLSPNAASSLMKLEPYGILIVLFLIHYTPVGTLLRVLTAAARSVLLG